MNQRQEKIIALLQERGGWIKGKDIAMVMDVSARTIRSDIETINAQLEQGRIESSPQRGYHLVMDRVYRSSERSAIPQTPDERRSFILKQLLRTSRISLSTLPELVYASDSTIENDLRIIRQSLADRGDLTITVRQNRVRLEGEEAAKRRLYKDLLAKEIEDNFMNLDQINALFPDFDLLEIHGLLQQCLEQKDLQIRQTAQSMLLMHVGVALTRLLGFRPIEEDPSLMDLTQTEEYQAASRFWKRIETRFPIRVPEAEILQLTLLLLGKSAGSYYRADEMQLDGHAVFLEDLTEQMLEAIDSYYGFGLSADAELRQGLQLHLRSLILRLQRHTHIDNLYLNELRWRFPLIFDMGITASDVFRQEFGVQLDSSEIGFLALHFGSAYTRRHTPPRYRVVLVFPREQSMGSFTIERIRTQFEDRIEIAAILSAFETQAVERLKPDLILTTLPFEHDLPIPTLQLSMFYSPTDESQIFQALNRLDRQKSRENFAHRIRKLIRPEFFWSSLDADSSEEVIRTLCDPLEAGGYIPGTFYQAVLERESYAPSSFQPGFALPHALKVDARRSAISIAFLSHPVTWGDYQVDLVLLLAIREEDRDLLGIFFDWWTQLVCNPLHYGYLKKHKDYASFIQAVLEEK